MNFGYVKVATFSPSLKVGDLGYNLEQIKKAVDDAYNQGVRLLAFPRLSITGSTLGDLFKHKALLDSAKKSLCSLAKYTNGKKMLIFVGLPIEVGGLVYSVAVGVCDGKILGIVPEGDISGNPFDFEGVLQVDVGGRKVPFGKDIIFSDSKANNFKVAVEFGSDVNSVISPSAYQVLSGARVIVNLASEAECSRKGEEIRGQLVSISNKAVCAYIYANAGEGESSTDFVFSGRSFIAECGKILSEKKPFEKGLNVAEIDLDAIDYLRGNRLIKSPCLIDNYLSVEFDADIKEQGFSRTYDKTPFIVEGEEELLIDIQAEGLKKRISHVSASTIVLGLSGGLDSTLALIVAVRAIRKLNRPVKDVLAITMPCFGTSSRTLDNSIKLAKAYGVTLKKVDITKSVKRHLKDIRHSETVHDAAYENAQARERTQVLMDVANMHNGLVVGTGDLSELALGWATYNGDHMSMYAVNGSIPKTLVRHLVNYCAEKGKGKLKSVLLDILDTPVSPELIPSGDKTIIQVTEDIVGPYVLHDYFLYATLKLGFSPKKVYYSAVNTFKGEFEAETILKWLKTFIRRFFNQQFKRSCMPDGVKATEISLSPRGGLNMPSDAVSKVWLDELENL